MKKGASFWNSFRGRFLVCLLISVFSLILIPIQTLSYIWRDSRTQVYKKFDDLNLHVAEKVSSIMEACHTSANFIGYSAEIQRHMFSKKPEEIILSRTSAMSSISNTLSISDYCLNIILYDTNDRYLYVDSSFVADFQQLISGNLSIRKAVLNTLP